MLSGGTQRRRSLPRLPRYQSEGIILIYILYVVRPIAAQGHKQSHDCKFDKFWLRFPLEESKYFISSLGSPVPPAYLCTGYSVKLNIDSM